MICPLCSTENKDTAVYCKNCNFSLLDASYEPSSSEVETIEEILKSETDTFYPSNSKNQEQKKFFNISNPNDIFKEVDYQLYPTNYKPYEKKPLIDKAQLKKSIQLATIIFVSIVSFFLILTGINYYLCLGNADLLNASNKNVITYSSLINDSDNDILKINFTYDMLNQLSKKESDKLFDEKSNTILNDIIFQPNNSRTHFNIKLSNGSYFNGVGNLHFKTKNNQLILEISDYRLGNTVKLLPWTQKILSPNKLEFPVSLNYIDDQKLKDFYNIFGIKLKKYEFEEDLLSLTFRVNPSYGTVSIHDYETPNYSTHQDFKSHWYYENGENILRIPLSTISSKFAGYSYNYDSNKNRLYIRKPLLGYDVDYSMKMNVTPTEEGLNFDFSDFKAGNQQEVFVKQHFFIKDTISKSYVELFEDKIAQFPKDVEFSYITANDYYLEFHSYVDEQQIVEEFTSNIAIENPYYVLKLLLLPDNYGKELAMYIDKILDKTFNQEDLNALMALIQTNDQSLIYLLGAFDKNGYDYFVREFGAHLKDIPDYQTVKLTQESLLSNSSIVNSDYSSFTLGNKFYDTTVGMNHTINGYIATKGLNLLKNTHSKLAFYDQNNNIVAIAYDEFSILDIHENTSLEQTKKILNQYKIDYTQKFDFDSDTLYLTIDIDANHSVNFIFDENNNVSYVIISKTMFVNYYI